VGIRHLGGHEQSEIVIVVLGSLTQLDLLNTTIAHKLRVHQNWVKTRINSLLDILHKDWVAIVHCSRYFSEESTGSKFEQAHLLLLVHIFDPLVCLLLRIDAKTPTLSTCREDTVLSGGLIGWETINAPAANNDRIAHDLNQAEDLRAWNLLFFADNIPFRCQNLSVDASKCSEIRNAGTGKENISHKLEQVLV